MAATCISAFGVMNLLGRLILPGYLPWNYARYDSHSISPRFLDASSLQWCTGAGFGIIPAFLADQFSSKNIGATHGVILTAWSLA
ncbi:hypothetical protein BJ742DRAFT_247772 [Cladochytrium replicatum]|nr:hypothetical protein BJ742DRAFT_247772 [Cladochytrium replicatum]